MARFDPSLDASHVYVWTYKEGLLSSVAHDLQIEAKTFRAPVTVENGRFKGELVVRPADLHINGQVHDGAVTPAPAKDVAQMEKDMLGSSILDAAKYPEIRFTVAGAMPTGGQIEAEGTLSLHGQTAAIKVPLRFSPEGDGFSVEGDVRFLQTAYGIKPFKAMLGALKIKDEVRVSWTLHYKPAN